MKSKEQGIGTLYLIAICIAMITVIMFVIDHSVSDIALGILICAGILYFGHSHFKKAEKGTDNYVGTCIAIVYNPASLTWTYTLHGGGKTVKVKAKEKLHIQKGLDYKFELCKGTLDNYKVGKPIVINEFFSYNESAEEANMTDEPYN